MHDRIHCVALVVDANNDPDYPMTEHVHEQIKKIQDLMNLKGKILLFFQKYVKQEHFCTFYVCPSTKS